MRLASRAAWIRLSALSFVLGLLVFWGWFKMIRMPGHSFGGPWTPLSADEAALQDKLRRDVEFLAGKIGDRNLIAYTQLNAAADFIEKEFSQSGLTVNRLGFEVQGKTCLNLEAEMRGRTRAGEIVVVGAHYDTVLGCPGANDNGSGVAAVLALARSFSTNPPARTLRFMAFVNEEPPHFQTATMGSRVYAKHCRVRNDNVVAMLSLETIGYYTDAASSQKYPFPVGLFYPSSGNFIAFVGDTSSASLVRECVALFRGGAKFPSEGAALVSWLPGIGWSDHWAFWQEGYPALMVTDTAPFRYPHYHTENDTPDKLSYDRMARVVAGLQTVIAGLVNP
ncbi:MAG: M28 family peptidase [Verrucomicrobia bacterium]|nr:M28 family peptidase [Verrucomicrobiota bacterium]